MPEFVYTAYDDAGARRQGQLAASSWESARLKVKELGLVPVEIKPVGRNPRRAGRWLRLQRQPGLADIEFLTSQLALLLKNGIKIDRALEMVSRSVANQVLKRVLEEVSHDVRGGVPLAQALEKRPQIFDALFVSVIRIGESTGQLAAVLSALAANLGFRRRVQARMSQALIYPTIILIVCILSIVFIFNFIVPKFAVIFASLKEVPFYTEILLSASRFVRNYQFLMLFGAVALAAVIWHFRRHQRLLEIRDRLLLFLPVTRRLCCTVENLRFVSSLAILLRSGVVLSEALAHAISTVGNAVLRKSLLSVGREIKQGQKFSTAMEKTAFLPETFAGLIEVGEQTGNLAEVFVAMEERLHESYENQVAGLITLIEPVMIIFMSLIVGSIVVVMLLSMVAINNIQF